jgi:hypothetical protein
MSANQQCKMLLLGVTARYLGAATWALPSTGIPASTRAAPAGTTFSASIEGQILSHAIYSGGQRIAYFVSLDIT